MANPHKGEVGFTAGGAERTLRYDINTICSLEESLGLSFSEIASRVGRVHVSTLRATLRAGLGNSVSLGAAGEIIAELGLRRSIDLVTEALTAAFPVKEDKIGLREASDLVTKVLARAFDDENALRRAIHLVTEALTRAFPLQDDGDPPPAGGEAGTGPTC